MSSTTDYDDTLEGAPSRPRGAATISAQRATEIRKSQQYKKARADFRAACARKRFSDGSVGEPCWLCGTQIDYRLAYPHPYSWSLDHAITVKERPELALDALNFRASHLDCNIARGTDDPKIDIGTPSELW